MSTNSPIRSEGQSNARLGRLLIGCPVWACEHWKGSLYRRKSTRSEWLQDYSRVFSTVEGNSTFYALPPAETVKRWAESVSSEFRFSLKMPRILTHELRLVNATAELEKFLSLATILDDRRRLGPTFIQLPPDFSPRESDALIRFLRALPTHLPWALEVRHHDWFDEGNIELQLNQLLQELNIDKVIFDSRPLFSKPPSDEIEAVSQKRKPKTPLRHTVTGNHPFLRLVGRNHLPDTQRWIDEWAPVIATWISQGHDPYVFTHAPDDRFAPEFARTLHRAVQRECPALPDLPFWPGEQEATSSQRQQLLF
ncbi:MAG: DUF72 domain-containing protein [Planctomyces sp.]|jgi:uncharacterized protein YecE (DUF72 family)